MLALISLQISKGMKTPKKPFHTAKFFLYRAAFEEAHFNYTEAADLYENAALMNSEPSKVVFNAFERFLERIRTITMEQMAHRPSLVSGVCRLREAAETSEDVAHLIEILDIVNLNEDFGTSQLEATPEEEDKEDWIPENSESTLNESSIKALDIEEKDEVVLSDEDGF